MDTMIGGILFMALFAIVFLLCKQVSLLTLRVLVLEAMQEANSDAAHTEGEDVPVDFAYIAERDRAERINHAEMWGHGDWWNW